MHDPARAPLFAAAPEDNDLLRALGPAVTRYHSPEDAICSAPAGAAVLLLANDPAEPQPLAETLLREAEARGLRLYIEFPAALPGLDLGAPRAVEAERAVVADAFFGEDLPPMRILEVNAARFTPVPAASVSSTRLALARVAGYDTAVYGLPDETFPLLFELPGHPNVLVATAPLSRFRTARFGPAADWSAVWSAILGWLAPSAPAPALCWTPSVRPSFGRDEALSEDAERAALARGVAWYERAGLLISPAFEKRHVAWDAAESVPAPPPDEPAGDGSLGVMQCFLSRIEPDGSQPVSWYRRGDCNGEAAMALALLAHDGGDARFAREAANVLDFFLFHSLGRGGPYADPDHGAYGLTAWGIDSAAYFKANYGDDNARLVLGALATAAATDEDRWDEAILLCLLGMLRTTGPLGFRRDRIEVEDLAEGWRKFFEEETVSYAPHYQAYVWACFLWAYRHTGFPLFRERAVEAIRRTMAVYPDEWRWTNGLQQERARMLLPLAWLIRIEDTPQHRAWLERITEDLLAAQDPCGAIREEIGSAGKGAYGPPATNEAYGTNEAPLIHRNGDPVADLLYTTNFAFIGLHEAAAATGDARFTEAADRLAAFLCRAQVRSEDHPELDGAWFRAFDFGRWDFYASNSDAGWGAWATETGWTQGWIAAVLALRRAQTSFWDLTAHTRIARHMETCLPLMLPDATTHPHRQG